MSRVARQQPVALHLSKKKPVAQHRAKALFRYEFGAARRAPGTGRPEAGWKLARAGNLQELADLVSLAQFFFLRGCDVV